MKRPLIGLSPLVDGARDSYWMLPGYMQGVERAGGIPVMLPLTTAKQALKQLAQAMDGFLFTGGQDVSPALHHSESSHAYVAMDYGVWFPPIVGKFDPYVIAPFPAKKHGCALFGKRPAACLPLFPGPTPTAQKSEPSGLAFHRIFPKALHKK